MYKKVKDFLLSPIFLYSVLGCICIAAVCFQYYEYYCNDAGECNENKYYIKALKRVYPVAEYSHTEERSDISHEGGNNGQTEYSHTEEHPDIKPLTDHSDLGKVYAQAVGSDAADKFIRKHTVTDANTGLKHLQVTEDIIKDDMVKQLVKAGRNNADAVEIVNNIYNDMTASKDPNRISHAADKFYSAKTDAEANKAVRMYHVLGNPKYFDTPGNNATEVTTKHMKDSSGVEFRFKYDYDSNTKKWTETKQIWDPNTNTYTDMPTKPLNAGCCAALDARTGRLNPQVVPMGSAAIGVEEQIKQIHRNSRPKYKNETTYHFIRDGKHYMYTAPLHGKGMTKLQVIDSNGNVKDVTNDASHRAQLDELNSHNSRVRNNNRSDVHYDAVNYKHVPDYGIDPVIKNTTTDKGGKVKNNGELLVKLIGPSEAAKFMKKHKSFTSDDIRTRAIKYLTSRGMPEAQAGDLWDNAINNMDNSNVSDAAAEITSRLRVVQADRAVAFYDALTSAQNSQIESISQDKVRTKNLSTGSYFEYVYDDKTKLWTQNQYVAGSNKLVKTQQLNPIDSVALDLATGRVKPGSSFSGKPIAPDQYIRREALRGTKFDPLLNTDNMYRHGNNNYMYDTYTKRLMLVEPDGIVRDVTDKPEHAKAQAEISGLAQYRYNNAVQNALSQVRNRSVDTGKGVGRLLIGAVLIFVAAYVGKALGRL